MNVSHQAIQQQAKIFVGDEDFSASNGWLQNFMKLHQLSLHSRTSLSQKHPADLEEMVKSFVYNVTALRKNDEFEFEDKFIVNMAETPVFFDLVPGKTIEKQGAKNMTIRTSGSDKHQVMVVFGCSS